jgi:vancomycin resistance protein VanJ
VLAPSSVTPKAAQNQAKPSTLRRLLSTLTVVVAVGYPLGLLAAILLFRFVGERWWVAAVGMYLPRMAFAVPLPVVIIAAALWGPRWALATQALSTYLVLFLLMGLNLGLGGLAASSSGPSIRVVSYNIDSGMQGADPVMGQIKAFAPDVVVLQEADSQVARLLTAMLDGWHVDRHGQFMAASRWPIRDVYVPPDLVYAKGKGGARYVRYTLETPFGLVDLFNMHPTSPREGFEELRGSGFRYELQAGRIFGRVARNRVEFNAFRRRRQVAGIAAAARASSRPVIIAGDTNLPGLSWLYGVSLGSFRDGFSSAGRGFGYTFPSKHPWMRIDRIMTNDRLQITSFGVGDRPASDHFCVFAVIAPAE